MHVSVPLWLQADSGMNVIKQEISVVDHVVQQLSCPIDSERPWFESESGQDSFLSSDIWLPVWVQG